MWTEIRGVVWWKEGPWIYISTLNVRLSRRVERVSWVQCSRLEKTATSRKPQIIVIHHHQHIDNKGFTYVNSQEYHRYLKIFFLGLTKFLYIPRAVWELLSIYLSVFQSKLVLHILHTLVGFDFSHTLIR